MASHHSHNARSPSPGAPAWREASRRLALVPRRLALVPRRLALVPRRLALVPRRLALVPRRLALVPTGILLFATALAGGDAPVAAEAQDSAFTTQDDSSLFRFASSVRRVAGDVVDRTDAAASYSTCERCQTVPSALQLVLVRGEAKVITPGNVAIRLTDRCLLCEPLASAEQFILGRSAPLGLTAAGSRVAGSREVAEVRRELRLRRAGPSNAEIQVRVDEPGAPRADSRRTPSVRAPTGPP